MRDFAILYENLDQTSSTLEKIDLMRQYFQKASPGDAAWALFFLSGKRLKRLIGTKLLHDWCIEISGYPEWLYQECYSSVGDTAETITLILPEYPSENNPPLSLAEWMEERILPLKVLDKGEQKQAVCDWWKKLNRLERYILNKILTGALRVGVSYLLTLRALHLALEIPRITLSQRLLGDWIPSSEFFLNLSAEGSKENKDLSPFPFYLASPLDKKLEDLGAPQDWQVEWKWDGIRSQIVKRFEKSAIWSRNIELINEQFPELVEMVNALPNLVLDGEILAFQNDLPLPFFELQKRLNRKSPSSEYIKNVPIIFMAYDLLEYEDDDLRQIPLSTRRKKLEQLIKKFPHPRLKISSSVLFQNWEKLDDLKNQARSQQTEGLMLKKKESLYGSGRQKGSWWKFKVTPMTIDAVLMYAQPGSGRRANLFTDYTFGVWQGDELIPIAKAYSGLSQDEITELDQWIRRNIEEKFGPVRKLKPYHVFELAFEAIQLSKRHKSGIAVRFPRIVRWRKDKKVEEAEKLEDVKLLLKQYENNP